MLWLSFTLSFVKLHPLFRRHEGKLFRSSCQLNNGCDSAKLNWDRHNKKKKLIIVYNVCGAENFLAWSTSKKKQKNKTVFAKWVTAMNLSAFLICVLGGAFWEDTKKLSTQLRKPLKKEKKKTFYYIWLFVRKWVRLRNLQPTPHHFCQTKLIF